MNNIQYYYTFCEIVRQRTCSRRRVHRLAVYPLINHYYFFVIGTFNRISENHAWLFYCYCWCALLTEIQQPPRGNENPHQIFTSSY